MLLYSAVFFLGLCISQLANVRTDGWSIGDWLSGIGVIVNALFLAFCVGMALEMRRKKLHRVWLVRRSDRTERRHERRL
jgi:hypothetical protein